MLTEMDKRLITKEEEKINHIEKLIPLLDPSNPVKSFEDLFKKYDIKNTTQHWYDSSPRFGDGEIHCDLCEKKTCKECEIWKKWYKSEEQLSFNNWIDIYGPGIWDMSQEESNEQAKEIITKAISKKENIERLFFAKSTKENEYYYIFYYNRDRYQYDWWFIFRRINEKDIT